MKPIVQKVLESGLIDQATADLMDRFRMLPEGASQLVRENALKDATQSSLRSLAESLAVEVEKEHKIRETYLDLERIRWPATVTFAEMQKPFDPAFPLYMFLAEDVVGVQDRMGRLYFRIDEVRGPWLKPGNKILRKKAGDSAMTATTILESQQLFIDDQPACWQVHAA